MESSFSIVVAGLIGGLGFFLLGMEFLSEGMKKLTGGQIKHFLALVTKNRLGAVVFGIVFTIFFQSSSAASVVLVGFVDAGLLVVRQTLPVLLGTGIGTTITAQLISFNFGTIPLLFIGIGFLIYAFSKGRWRSLGKVLLGFGLLFFGMDLMGDSMIPLRDYPPFIQLLVKIEEPFWGVVAGLFFTAIIQSSAAFIGILIVLANSGLLTFEASLPLILGTNIGTTVTANLAAIKASGNSRKLALANTVFRIIASAVFFLLLNQWLRVSYYITGNDHNLGRLIANAHTIYNFGMVFLLLPISNLSGRLFDRLIPEAGEAPEYKLSYLKDEILESPIFFLPLLRKEIIDMGKGVLGMVTLSLEPFISKRLSVMKEIYEMEQQTDFYREEINRFLVMASRKLALEEQEVEIYRLWHIVNELEQIADIVAVNIARQAEKWLVANTEFSERGKKELEVYHLRCLKQLSRALKLVENMDVAQAKKMKEKYRKYAFLALDLEKEHYKRLLDDTGSSVGSSKVHVELLNLFRVINSRATNFGRLVLMQEENE